MGSRAFLCIFLLVTGICGAQEEPATAPGKANAGLPWDWSHEHVIFSETSDPDVLTTIQQDPRWFHQQWRRNQPAADAKSTRGNSSGDQYLPNNLAAPVKPVRDWGANIGAGSAITATNSTTIGPLYPAKYTLNINLAPNCAKDYAVFVSGTAGTNTGGNPTPSLIAFKNLYSTQPAAGGFCNTNGPTVAWAYLNVTCATSTTTSPDAIVSSPVLSEDGKKVAWVTSTGKVQILTIGTTGSNGTSVSTAVCIENVPGSTGTSPNNAVLNSVTLTNARRTPGAAAVTTSEVYVDYNSDTAYVGDDDGFLHKITPFFTATSALQESSTAAWVASHAYTAGALIIDTNGFVQMCTKAGTSKTGGHPAWSMTWGGTTADNTATWTNEGSGGGWPLFVTGSSGHTDHVRMASPVFDRVSKNILAGDANGSLFYILDPGTSTAVGACANGQTLYPCVGTPGAASGIAASGGAQTDCLNATPHATCLVASRTAFSDPVSVDSTNGIVMLHANNADGANAKIEQTNVSLSVFNSVNTGAQGNQTNHFGAFDNAYYKAPASGYYYFCGPNAAGNTTELYRIGFTSVAGTVGLGTITATPLQVTVTNQRANCTGLTEIYNTPTTTDWLFLGVDGHGVTATCANSPCIMSFKLGSSMVSSVNASYAGTANLKSFGGIIVDNAANTTTYPQASSIYFTPTANNLSCGDGSTGTVCAIKLTQAALQ